VPDAGFQTFQEEVSYHFNELYRLMWSMVWDKANVDRWLLEPEEIFAELSAELVHIVKIYGGNGKSHSEMKRILIVSLRNRATDLCVMAYGTHRKAEIGAWSLDSGADVADSDDGTDQDMNLWDIAWSSSGSIETFFNLEDEIADLSEDAQALIRMAVYQDDERFQDQLDLAECRKLAVSTENQWGLKTTPLILRRAMGWPKARFDNAWDEVAEFVGSLA